MRIWDRLIIGFLALLFLLTGLDKAFHHEGFVHALQNYVLVPFWSAPYLAPVVWLLEITVGLGLLLRAWRRPAAMAASVLMMVFTVALVINHLYGDRGICGCWFTVTLAKGTGMHVAQNLTLLGLSLTLWWGDGTGGRHLERLVQKLRKPDPPRENILEGGFQ